ncbi:MAG: hypothetical protein P4L98_11970 [Ancalomicrobiaceae bacterium]|nr:hypothetical protein [Ancalomicrobiaceae bacterium]
MKPLHFLIIVGGLASVSVASAPPASAGCEFGAIKYCGGCTVDRNITATPGATCHFTSWFAGGIVSAKTLVKPAHGIYARGNAYDFAYKIDPGYRGEDYFEFEFVYRTRFGSTEQVVVRNHVTIKN